MSTSTSTREARARRVRFVGSYLLVDLEDDRSLRVPLSWFPRLLHATPSERRQRRFIAGGLGIHWASLDEDISVENLLNGRRSGEGQRSLERWPSTRPPRVTES